MRRWTWHGWAMAVLLATAAAFYLPALAATGGVYPAPLDDTYIYLGHARALAQGYPLSWFAHNGYSSGATAVLYPALLAPAWLFGLRGSSLGWMAAAVALCGWLDLACSLRRLAGRGAGWLVPIVLVAVPLLSWSWLCGMEIGLVGALSGRSLLATDRALRAPAHERRRAQWGLGGWLALLVLTRPETVAFAAAAVVAATHGAGSLSTRGSLARAGLPWLGAMGGHALANKLLSGEWAQAGAVRKLLLSDPYRDAPSIALEVTKNAAVLLHQAFFRQLGGLAGLAALGLLCAMGLRRRGRLGAALCAGALGSFALSCLNATARFQNYRYAATPMLLLLMLACLGMGARRRPWPGAAMVLILCAATARSWRPQIDHFARASANILEQHGVVAEKLRRLGARRVLVGDAGAIPYLSGVPPIDGLGLGGFRGLPFARASVYGTASVVELIERLEPRDRPDVMALYPGWWRGLYDVFGRRIDAVRIRGNVICAAGEKVIYRTDWSPLDAASAAGGPVLQVVDVGDPVSEQASGYVFAAPGAGWVVGAVLPLGARQRWDAGRILPPGRAESWRVAATHSGPVELGVRTSLARARAEVRVWRDGARIGCAPLVSGGGPGWREARTLLPPLARGDRLEIVAGSEWRSFHIWLIGH